MNLYKINYIPRIYIKYLKGFTSTNSLKMEEKLNKAKQSCCVPVFFCFFRVFKFYGNFVEGNIIIIVVL